MKIKLGYIYIIITLGFVIGMAVTQVFTGNLFDTTLFSIMQTTLFAMITAAVILMEKKLEYADVQYLEKTEEKPKINQLQEITANIMQGLQQGFTLDVVNNNLKNMGYDPAITESVFRQLINDGKIVIKQPEEKKPEAVKEVEPVKVEEKPEEKKVEEKKETKLVCPECGKAFKKQERLDKHRIEKHSEELLKK